jgi:hypothetical protein
MLFKLTGILERISNFPESAPNVKLYKHDYFLHIFKEWSKKCRLFFFYGDRKGIIFPENSH